VHFPEVYFPVFKNDSVFAYHLEYQKFEIGKAWMVSEGEDVSIFATGHLVWEAIQACEILEAKGIKGCGVFTDRSLKEFCKASETIISENLSTYRKEMENLLIKYF
jgi:transketolase C-terminal domain/subunit